jgi:hypothetical protein
MPVPTQRLLFHRIENLNDFSPGRLLTVVDFPKIQQVTLHPPTTRAHLFGDAPVAMVLPVFEPVMTLEKGFSHTDEPDSIISAVGVGRDWVCTKRLFENAFPANKQLRSANPLKTAPSCESRGSF